MEDLSDSDKENYSEGGADQSIPDVAEYLKRIEQELAEREARLLVAENEILEIKFRLEGASLRRELIKGDVLGIRAAEEFRRSMAAKLTRSEALRLEILREVKMARDRKNMIEEEIRERQKEDE